MGRRAIEPCEVDLLSAAIRRDHPSVEAGRDFVWTAAPAVKVIDCVLSLNRNYDRIVAPRVMAFAKEFPRITTCAELGAEMDSHPSAAAFLERALDYRFPQRARILREVAGHMDAVQARFDGNSEDERLAAWARAAQPQEFRSFGVKGFGLAGFQYMRMLFGAETTKPDIHITRFVSETIDRRVSDIDALLLLEEASIQCGLSLRWLDVAIWESRAR